MNFGEALAALKAGKRVQRAGWNGKGMWLILVPGTPSAQVREGTPYANAGLSVVNINPHIDMKTATGEMQPGWLASQTDMLADDWQEARDYKPGFCEGCGEPMPAGEEMFRYHGYSGPCPPKTA